MPKKKIDSAQFLNYPSNKMARSLAFNKAYIVHIF